MCVCVFSLWEKAGRWIYYVVALNYEIFKEKHFILSPWWVLSLLQNKKAGLWGTFPKHAYELQYPEATISPLSTPDIGMNEGRMLPALSTEQVWMALSPLPPSWVILLRHQR